MINKQRLYRIVFHNDTKSGKLFDVILLWAILISIFVAILDSISNLNQAVKDVLLILEWFFTILFTIEYFTRIYVSKKPQHYIFSYWGIIDLLAIFPTYLSLFFFGSRYFLVVRILRLLRVFRILRLVRFYSEAFVILNALKKSFYKISIFLSTVVVIVILLGSVMYVVEGGQNGFTSIPQSIYWAVITITTVGYGDIVPQTVLGKLIASVTMLLGYSILAVPTGIITVEMSKLDKKRGICINCGSKNKENANYCNDCGAKIKSEDIVKE